MITVMGATGNTGKVVARSLLAAGEKVRLIGRSADRLEPLAAQGAEVAIGDALDGAFLARAFGGADAAYAMIPPDYGDNDYLGRYDRIGAAIAEALRGSGVRKVVLLSSLGAEHSSGTGPIVGLHRQEERLKQVAGVDLLILRPGYFMENLMANIGLIRSAGINGGAIAPDVRFAVIATRDIGVAAANALRSREFRGVSVKELLGPRDVSMREITRALGARIGKPDLAYVQFQDEEFTKGLIGAGFAPALAASFVEMSHAIADGRVRTIEGRNAANSTPTSIEDFAETFARAYGQP